jgi:hypothetical protein
MEPELIAIGARHAERLVIALAGTLSIFLGYRLFIAMPLAERGSGKIQLPGGVSILLSRVYPGVFFALFGALVIGYGLHQTVQLQTGPATVAGIAPQAAATQAPGGLNYSGIAPRRETDGAREAARMGAVQTVGQLARVAAALQGPSGAALTPEQRIDLPLALSDARVRLMAQHWDDAWGPFAEFQRWIAAGEAEPVPASIATAVRLYRGAR